MASKIIIIIIQSSLLKLICCAFGFWGLVLIADMGCMLGSAQEEIDIEAKVLRAGKAVGVAVVELKKKSGKIIAQARYSKYLGVASSKL